MKKCHNVRQQLWLSLLLALLPPTAASAAEPSEARVTQFSPQGTVGFSTGGPAIQTSSPSGGTKSIEEEQAFVLVLDAEPSEASLRQHVWFAVDGVPERIGIRVITGEPRAAILKTFYRGFSRGRPSSCKPSNGFPTRRWSV